MEGPGIWEHEASEEAADRVAALIRSSLVPDKHDSVGPIWEGCTIACWRPRLDEKIGVIPREVARQAVEGRPASGKGHGCRGGRNRKT